MSRSHLPKAYLRLDPNVDQTHPDNLGEFIRLLCAANRQPHRGYFKTVRALEGLFGRAAVKRFLDRGDIARQRDGTVYVPGWDHWQEGDLTVAERMQRLRDKVVSEPSQDRNGESNGGVTEPYQTPSHLPSPPSEASRRIDVREKKAPSTSESLGNGEPSAKDARLTREQYEAWGTFGPEWAPFKMAWITRGFLFPPAGEPDDNDTSQRGLLWQVLDARPSDLPRWVCEAPGATTRQVIQYVLDRWHEIRQSVAEDELDRPTATLERQADAERLSSILARLPLGEAKPT